MVAEIVAFAPPLNDALPVTSPVNSIVRDVVKVAAAPVVFAFIVSGSHIVTAPDDAETSTSFAVP